MKNTGSKTSTTPNWPKIHQHEKNGKTEAAVCPNGTNCARIR